MIILMYKNKNKENAKIIVGVLSFLFLPLIGALLQIHFRLYFQFTGLAFGVLIIFVFLETTSGNKDYLTNLFSRRILNEYLDTLIENNTDFSMVMMDLDAFKEVNDNYGHAAGDEVLIEFSKILQQIQRSKGSLITRLGGDEFLCVLVKKDDINIESCIQKIYKIVKENEVFNKYKDLSFSYGILHYDHKMTPDELLIEVDTLMYQHKNNKR